MRNIFQCTAKAALTMPLTLYFAVCRKSKLSRGLSGACKF